MQAGLRRRLLHHNGSYDDECNSNYVSYIDRVRFARRKKPDTWTTVICESVLVVLVILIGVLTFLYRSNLHLNVLRIYSSLGFVRAQNQLSQHLLNEPETQADIDEAIYWLRKAASKGDPVATYNLVVAHMKDHAETEGLTMDDVHRMLEHAGTNGITQAKHLSNSCTTHGGCSRLAKKLNTDSNQL